MIDFVHGDILQAETDALVNTVNTVGVMGKGVALQFKRRFPDNKNCSLRGPYSKGTKAHSACNCWR